MRTTTRARYATFEATTLNGITAESLGSGSYHIYGTSTAGTSITKTLDNVVTLPNTTFYLHYRNNTASGLAAFIFYPPTGGMITNYSFNPANRISEIPSLRGKTVGQIGFYIQANVTLDITFTPTLEFSNAVTDYEPFAGADYTLTPAFTLYGLTSTISRISPIPRRKESCTGKTLRRCCTPKARKRRIPQASHWAQK